MHELTKEWRPNFKQNKVNRNGIKVPNPSETYNKVQLVCQTAIIVWSFKQQINWVDYSAWVMYRMDRNGLDGKMWNGSAEEFLYAVCNTAATTKIHCVKWYKTEWGPHGLDIVTNLMIEEWHLPSNRSTWLKRQKFSKQQIFNSLARGLNCSRRAPGWCDYCHNRYEFIQRNGRVNKTSMAIFYLSINKIWFVINHFYSFVF